MSAPTIESVAPEGFAALFARIEAIDEAAGAADGYSSLGDAARRDLAGPDARSAGRIIDDRAYGHAWPIRTATPDSRWEIAVTLAPAARHDGSRVLILRALLTHIASAGGGPTVWWAPGASERTDADAATVGLVPSRDLLRMEAPLPLSAPPPDPGGTTQREFNPGPDDRAWLALNNAAFAGHPEQGAWTPEMLHERCAEPWFDPALFIVAEADGALVGANWVRAHPGGEAEIYVISVARSHRGLGLGRTLAFAGLAAATRRGSTRASLYCAADNDPARRLYSELGFRVTRTDRAYETEVPNR